MGSDHIFHFFHICYKLLKISEAINIAQVNRLDLSASIIDSLSVCPSIGGSRGGARLARAPPFAWHPSSLADLGGACPVRAPPFAWHPSF